MLLVLGGGIAVEAIRRAVVGSEPIGLIMMVYSVVSFAVSLYVLVQLSKYRKGEVHIRASYICTRTDVIANVAVFLSGVIVGASGVRFVDLIAGLTIGIYVLKEAMEIMFEANEVSEQP